MSEVLWGLSYLVLEVRSADDATSIYSGRRSDSAAFSSKVSHFHDFRKWQLKSTPAARSQTLSDYYATHHILFSRYRSRTDRDILVLLDCDGNDGASEGSSVSSNNQGAAGTRGKYLDSTRISAQGIGRPRKLKYKATGESMIVVS